MKEIIETDTNPMKEVLRPGRELLPLPHKKICCPIWAKEGDHEGDH